MTLAAGCNGPQQLNREKAIDLGHDYYTQGRYLDAIAAYEAAREQNRESPEISCYIGRCYLKLADKEFRDDSLIAAMRYSDKADLAFRNAYEAFPGYVGAMDGKAEALRRKGETEAALALADWAVKACGPRARVLVFKAREYANAGDVDQALAILREAVDADPKNPAGHAELGRFYARFGRTDEAIDSLRRAEQLNPKAPGVSATIRSLESERGSPTQTTMR